MNETICAAPLLRQSDFFQEPAGTWIDGACGPTGLAGAASSSLGRVITPKSVYDLMRAHNLCDPNGASVMPAADAKGYIGGLYAAAELLGCEIVAYRPYGEPWTDWEAWHIQQLQAGNPVVTEVAFGQALKDAVTGLGDNFIGSLNYHYIWEAGYFAGAAASSYAEKMFNKLITVPGFWAGDGDNWAGGNGVANNFNCTNQLQFYPTSVMAAARPCAALALKGRPITVAWNIETDGSGKDGAGHVCSAGYMAAMKANPADLASDGLASSVALPNATSFLALASGTVYVADPPSEAFKRFAVPGLAQEWMKLYGLYQKAASAPPPPAPISPADQAAINAVAALKAALA